MFPGNAPDRMFLRSFNVQGGVRLSPGKSLFQEAERLEEQGLLRSLSAGRTKDRIFVLSGQGITTLSQVDPF